MEKNQLRDGNWIKTKPDAPFVQDYIMQINAAAIANFSENFNGVPLTKGLWNSGSLPMDSKGIEYMRVGLLYLLWATDHLIVSYLDSDGTYVDVHAPRIYFVHELQNLYLLLTGKELEIIL